MVEAGRREVLAEAPEVSVEMSFNRPGKGFVGASSPWAVATLGWSSSSR